MSFFVPLPPILSFSFFYFILDEEAATHSQFNSRNSTSIQRENLFFIRLKDLPFSCCCWCWCCCLLFHVRNEIFYIDLMASNGPFLVSFFFVFICSSFDSSLFFFLRGLIVNIFLMSFVLRGRNHKREKERVHNYWTFFFIRFTDSASFRPRKGLQSWIFKSEDEKERKSFFVRSLSIFPTLACLSFFPILLKKIN